MSSQIIILLQRHAVATDNSDHITKLKMRTIFATTCCCEKVIFATTKVVANNIVANNHYCSNVQTQINPRQNYIHSKESTKFMSKMKKNINK